MSDLFKAGGTADSGRSIIRPGIHLVYSGAFCFARHESAPAGCARFCYAMRKFMKAEMQGKEINKKWQTFTETGR